jgi:hypothetical protein
MRALWSEDTRYSLVADGRLRIANTKQYHSYN